MRGIFSLVTLCAVLTLSSCATYSYVDSGANCEAAGKNSILTQAECEAAYVALEGTQRTSHSSTSRPGCISNVGSSFLIYNTNANGSFECVSTHRCVCSETVELSAEPTVEPADATAAEPTPLNRLPNQPICNDNRLRHNVLSSEVRLPR